MNKIFYAIACISTTALAMQSPEPFRPTILAQTQDNSYTCVKTGEHKFTVYFMDPELGVGVPVGGTLQGDNAGFSPNNALLWVLDNHYIRVYNIKNFQLIASIPGDSAAFSDDSKKIWVESIGNSGQRIAATAYNLEEFTPGKWRITGLSRYCSGMASDVTHCPCDTWAM